MVQTKYLSTFFVHNIFYKYNTKVNIKIPKKKAELFNVRTVSSVVLPKIIV